MYDMGPDDGMHIHTSSTDMIPISLLTHRFAASKFISTTASSSCTKTYNGTRRDAVYNHVMFLALLHRDHLLHHLVLHSNPHLIIPRCLLFLLVCLHKKVRHILRFSMPSLFFRHLSRTTSSFNSIPEGTAS